MTENTLDRKDLKILAYKERVAELLDTNADLRVEVTILSRHAQELQELLKKYEEPTDVPAEDS